MQVASLQAVMPKSPEYSLASPSPPRTRVVGRRVGRGKELCHHWIGRRGSQLTPTRGRYGDSDRHHRSGALRRSMPARTATTWRRRRMTTLPHSVSSSLLLNSGSTTWMSGWRSRRSTGWIWTIRWTHCARPFVRRSNALQRPLGTRSSTEPRTRGSRSS